MTIREVETPARPVPRPLDLGLLWGAFIRSLPIALLIGVLAGGATYFIQDGEPPVYEVTSTVSLGVLSDADIPDWIVARAEPVYLSMAQDRETVEQVSAVTGVPDPVISAESGAVQGVILISAEASDVAQARSLVDETVMTLIRRSARMHETAMFAASTQSEQLTAPLRAQIAARQLEDPLADISDLEWEIQLIAREIETSIPEVVPPVQVSQTDNDGEPVRPQPLNTALVGGMAAGLIALLPLIWWNFSNPRKVGRMWLRGLRNRYGVDTETASFADSISPLAEARAVQTLSTSGTVLLLGQMGSLSELEGSGRIYQADWFDPWWREVPPNEVGLAIVTVEKRSKKLRDIEKLVAHLTGMGIPTMVAFNNKEENNGSHSNRS